MMSLASSEWIFNTQLAYSTTSNESISNSSSPVAYLEDETALVAISIQGSDETLNTVTYTLQSDPSTQVIVYSNGSWINDDYRTITFSDDADESDISSGFESWLDDNAVDITPTEAVIMDSVRIGDNTYQITSFDKGSPNGVAPLDQNGMVPSEYLPSYVDDVLEYASTSEFPLTGETGKIYVALDTNKTYRWGGTEYVEISESLALGETSSTAYRGDRGAAAYAAAVTNPDSSPTSGSNNLVKSGGVYTALDAKAPTDCPAFTSSISMGRKANTTVGSSSVAVGLIVTASGAQSHAEGNNTIASGSYSHAEGYGATNKGALGKADHVEGYNTLANSGTNSGSYGAHAEGSNTTASSTAAHSEGSNTTASGSVSHAEGSYTTASGSYSHAEGRYTIANHASQHVFGEYNVADPNSKDGTYKGNYVEIIGNGTSSSAKSNARTLDWYGNERLKGDLYVGCAADSTGGTKVATVSDIPDITGKADKSATVSTISYDTTNKKITKTINGTTTDVVTASTLKTDMSLNNVTNDEQIPKSIGTAKGDIIYFSEAGTPTVLPVGADGKVLKLASGVPTWGTDSNSDTKVQQNASLATTTAGNYPVILAYSTATTKVTNVVNKSSALTYTPSTETLNIGTGTITASNYSGKAATAGDADTVNGKTIASDVPADAVFTDTTYESKTAASGGTDVSLVTTGDKYTWDNKYSKPSGGIPASDIASGVIPDTSVLAPKDSPEFTSSITLGSRKSGTTVGDRSTALGNNITSSGSYSFAVGNSTTASANMAFAEGQSTTASGPNAHSEGYYTTASASAAHAEGSNTTASADSAHAEGNATTASGAQSHAEGSTTTASGAQSHAEGCGASGKGALGKADHAEGYQTLANSGTNSGSYGAHAEGKLTTASASAAHAEGYSTTASGNYSHAEGNDTTASGDYSHAEGWGASGKGALGKADHAEGYLTLANSGTNSGSYGAHAEGNQTTASANGAHAEGNDTTALSIAAHSEGSNTTASASAAHAEGNYTTASGAQSHAEGNYTTASGSRSHAEGYYTIANHRSQHVSGEYNVADPSTVAATSKGTYLEIIGNGTSSSNKSNARTLDWNGNERLMGDLYVGCSADSSGGTKLPTMTDVADYVNKFVPHKIYGFHIDSTESSSANCVTYLADAVGMTPAYMDKTNNIWEWGSWEDAFFMPRPCLLNRDGTVEYYLDPNDYSKREDGQPADITDSAGAGRNVMMEWGRNGRQIWYKIVPEYVEADNDYTSASIYIADYQADSDYHAYPFINGDGELKEHFYTACYNGTLDSNGALRSLSGVTGNLCKSKTVTEEITAAKKNNTAENDIWDTELYSDITLINFLTVLITKNINTKASIGTGLVSNGSASIVDNFTTGIHNSSGLFHGTSRIDASEYTNAVKVFGMENWWGFLWHRFKGFVIANGTVYYKLTKGTEDGSTGSDYVVSSTVSDYSSNYIMGLDGYVPTTNGGYIKKMSFNKQICMPKSAGGSSSTYYGCALYNGNSGLRYAYRGGYTYNSTSAGMWCLYLNDSHSSTGAHISTVLSCKP